MPLTGPEGAFFNGVCLFVSPPHPPSQAKRKLVFHRDRKPTDRKHTGECYGTILI